jgi:hypothetical protein
MIKIENSHLTPYYYVLDQRRKNQQFPWCQKALSRFRLPPSYHGHAKYHVWQRRSFDMNIYSEKKRLEKLDYMHANPVKRRLVKKPGDWPWSSWRFYYLGDISLLAMDHKETASRAAHTRQPNQSLTSGAKDLCNPLNCLGSQAPTDYVKPILSPLSGLGLYSDRYPALAPQRTRRSDGATNLPALRACDWR